MAQLARDKLLHRLPSLSGLRFFPAVLVFLVHALVAAEPFRNQTLQDATIVVLPLGIISVSVFFTLSGFVLAWSARDEFSRWVFWRSRIAKIFPNHLVVWFAVVAVLAATGVAVTGSVQGDGFPWGPALTNLLLIHAWIPQPYSDGVNIVTWSLSAEVFFYLLFPFLLPLVRRIPERRLWAACGAAVVAAWTVPVIALQLGGAPVDGLEIPEWQFWVPYFFPLSRLPEFVLGMLLARLVQTGRRTPVGRTLSVVLVVVCLGAALALLPFPFWPAAATIVPVALLLVAVADADVRERRSWLRRPTMILLGNLAFALYLVHWPVILLTTWLLDNRQWGVPGALAQTAGLFLLSILLAWLLHTRVEVPMMRRLATGAHWARTRNPEIARTPSPEPDTPDAKTLDERRSPHDHVDPATVGGQ